jgi:hypothetical protein
LSIIRSPAVQHFPVFARDLEQLVADFAIRTLSGQSRKPLCLSAKKVNAVHDALPRVFQAEARFAQVPRLGLILKRQPKARLYKIEHLPDGWQLWQLKRAHYRTVPRFARGSFFVSSRRWGGRYRRLPGTPGNTAAAPPHPITPAMALRLGKLCGNGPDLWLRMQQAHELWHAQEALQKQLNKIPAAGAAA